MKKCDGKSCNKGEDPDNCMLQECVPFSFKKKELKKINITKDGMSYTTDVVGKDIVLTVLHPGEKLVISYPEVSPSQLSDMKRVVAEFLARGEYLILSGKHSIFVLEKEKIPNEGIVPRANEGADPNGG